MECDGCTLCCKLLDIKETDSKPGEYCKHCEPGVGCKIYNERPEPCRIFECAWKQMKHAGEELRPDKCNVLFEKWSDYVMVGTTTEDSLSGLVLGQIEYFKKEGISTLMVNHIKKTRTFFLADGYTKEFVKDEINGSTKLH
jgi:hypothetical protein